MKNNIITFREAIRSALFEQMLKDKRTILIGEDIGLYGGAFGVTRGLIDKFEDQIIETPISENSFVGVALGAAIGGYKPIVEIMFSDFVTLAMDQIINHAAKIRYIYAGQLNAPLIIRLPTGGGRGYGASHSQSLEAWFAHIPGLVVLYPSTPQDAKGLMLSAMQEKSPVIYFENKLLYDVKGSVNTNSNNIPIGSAKVLKNGEDVSLISYGRMLKFAEEASISLEQLGISAEILDLRSLKPLDENKIIQSVKKTGRVIVITESVSFSGIAAEVSALLADKCFDYMKSPISRITAMDVPIPSATRLEKNIFPNTEKIVEEAVKLVN